jgi:hypothetical protein
MSFLANKNLLITASKDKYIRFWNLKGAQADENQLQEGQQNFNNEFDTMDPDYSDQMEPEPQVYQRPQTKYSQTTKRQNDDGDDDPLSKQFTGKNAQNQPQPITQPSQTQNQQKPPRHESDEEDDDLAGWND